MVNSSPASMPLASMATARGSFPHMTMLGVQLVILGGADSPNDKMVEELLLDDMPMVWAEVNQKLSKGRSNS